LKIDFNLNNACKKTSPRVALTLTGIALAYWATATDTQAQPRLIPPDADTSRMRVPVPLPRLPEFDLRIQSPEKSATPRAVDELEFELKGVKFDGGTRYSEQEMLALFQPLFGQRISLEAFRERVRLLEDRYRKDGFFLTRVLIPPQQVKDGVFTVQIIEGFISEAFVDGTDGPDRRLVERITSKVVDKKPIDLRSLEQALLILNDLPGMGATGTLRPGAVLGSSELVVTLSPPQKVSYSLGLNNFGSKFIGPWGMSVNATVPRPFEQLGSLGVGLSNSAFGFDRLHAVTLSYSRPVGSSGSVLSIGTLAAIARPAGSIKSLRIYSESWSLSPRLRMPLLRTVRHSFFLDAGLSINESEAFLNHGTPERIAISHDRSSVAEVALSYQQSGFGGGSTQASLSIFQGLDAFGSLSPSQAPLSSAQGFRQRFQKQTLSISRQQSLPNRFSLSLLAQAQDANDILLSGDQTFFGGVGIGRGYDGGILYGERGFGLLGEIRWNYANPATLGLPENSSLQLFASYDFARATRIANPTSETPQSSGSISSTAVGFRIRTPKGLSIETMLANPNTYVASIDRKPGPRIVFSLNQSFF
jgi:hemolysin activation/secretion protein